MSHSKAGYRLVSTDERVDQDLHLHTSGIKAVDGPLRDKKFTPTTSHFHPDDLPYTTRTQVFLNDESQLPLKTRLYNLWYKNRGLLLIGSSTFTGNCMMVTVKLMSNRDSDVSPEEDAARPHIHPVQLIGIRMFITWFLCAAWMLYDKVPHPILGPPGVRGWLTLRGIAGFFGLFGAYYSIQYISLSDSTTIGFLTPFVTAFLGRVLLKEAYSRVEALGAVTSFLGVILIARPTFLFGHPSDPSLHSINVHQSGTAGSADGGVVHAVSGTPHVEHSSEMRFIAVCIQLLGVLGASLAYTSMRRVGQVTHVMHSVAYFNLWCFIVSVVATPLFGIQWILPNWKWWLGLLLIGALGFMGQLMSARGFQLETAGRGTLALYISIVFSLAFEKVVFHHQPKFLSMIGIAIILTSAIYVAVNKPNAQPEGPRDEEIGLNSIAEEDEDEVTLREEDSEGELRKVHSPNMEEVEAREVPVHLHKP